MDYWDLLELICLSSLGYRRWNQESPRDAIPTVPGLALDDRTVSWGRYSGERQEATDATSQAKRGAILLSDL